MDQSLLKVLLTSLAGRYTRALFEEAHYQQATEIVKTDLKKLMDFWQENPDVWKGLANKALNLHQINDLWQQVGDKLKLCRLTIQFMVYLSQVKRLNLWPSIFQIYQFQQDAFLKRRQIFVETVRTLAEGDKDNLVRALQKIWTGKLMLTFYVNPKLKAGIIIHVDNLCLDISLNSQLITLERLLRKDK